MWSRSAGAPRSRSGGRSDGAELDGSLTRRGYRQRVRSSTTGRAREGGGSVIEDHPPPWATTHREATIAELSEEQRADAFRGLTEEERRRALAEGTPRASGRYVGRFVAGLVLLGVLGLVADYYFGQVGSTPAPARVSTTTLPADSSASLAHLMSLRPIAHASAPAISLVDQAGTAWTLAAARGKAVVLTFFNADCHDICPIVGEELRRADDLLGARRSEVDLVVVNTNPDDLAVAPDPPALARTGLDRLTNVYFLNGSLAQLDAVWSSYGVGVTVGATPGETSHTAIMYFIGRHGGLADIATPFAHQSRAGDLTLSAVDVSRWAEGIARTAGSLLP